MKREVLSTIALLCVAFMVNPVLAQQPLGPSQQTPVEQRTPIDVAVVPIGDAQGALMKSKLVTAQKVLAGLVRKDFDAIASGARDMKRISEAAEWPRARDSVYEHFGKIFRQQCNQLEQLASQSNSEGVTFTYLSMTNSCVNCHDYVRDSFRIAQPNQGNVRLIPSEWPAMEAEPNINRQPKRSD